MKNGDSGSTKSGIRDQRWRLSIRHVRLSRFLSKSFLQRNKVVFFLHYFLDNNGSGELCDSLVMKYKRNQPITEKNKLDTVSRLLCVSHG